MANRPGSSSDSSTALLQELVSTMPAVMVVPLTVEEAKQIRTSFMRIAERLEEIGTASFSELFTHHPEAIRIFVSNKVFPDSITEVQYSWELKSHALRVMHTFEKIINRLDKPSTVWSGMISEIGCRHAAYSAKPAYLPVLVAAFRHAFFKEFTRAGIMTEELANVWYKLFNNMTVLMTSAVVASFLDSYGDYKRGASPAPAWLTAPAAADPHAPVGGSLSSAQQNGSKADLAPTSFNHAPACPSPSVKSTTSSSSGNTGKCPRQASAECDTIPAATDGSRSTSMRKKFADMLHLPHKSSNSSPTAASSSSAATPPSPLQTHKTQRTASENHHQQNNSPATAQQQSQCPAHAAASPINTGTKTATATPSAPLIATTSSSSKQPLPPPQLQPEPPQQHHQADITISRSSSGDEVTIIHI